MLSVDLSVNILSFQKENMKFPAHRHNKLEVSFLLPKKLDLFSWFQVNLNHKAGEKMEHR